MRTVVVFAAVLGLGAVALGGGAGAASADPSRGAEDRLGERIEAAIKADGPFFSGAERAVIERKCGYPAGSFDGFEVNIRDGVLTCKDGRGVDDAEMRGLLAVAEPRISRRVERVMQSAEVQSALREVAHKAEQAALAAIDGAAIAREAAAAAREAMREAQAEGRRRR
jgi:regulator of protease activity HflC (stomatin/prohibitin superfamily)